MLQLPRHLLHTNLDLQLPQRDRLPPLVCLCLFFLRAIHPGPLSLATRAKVRGGPSQDIASHCSCPRLVLDSALHQALKYPLNSLMTFSFLLCLDPSGERKQKL